MYLTEERAKIEEQRLAYLHSLAILDTPREEAFDRLIFTIAQIARAPMAALSFMDRDQQWRKSYVGLHRQTAARAISVCAYTIWEPDILIVTDTMADPRFREFPGVVGDPFIRAYAGVPLVASNGLVPGLMCIADRRPRAFEPEHLADLRVLAKQAMRLLEKRAEAIGNARGAVAAETLRRDSVQDSMRAQAPSRSSGGARSGASRRRSGVGGAQEAFSSP